MPHALVPRLLTALAPALSAAPAARAATYDVGPGQPLATMRLSIADVSIGAHFGRLAPAGFEIDAQRWPRTTRHRAALEATAA